MRNMHERNPLGIRANNDSSSRKPACCGRQSRTSQSHQHPPRKKTVLYMDSCLPCGGTPSPDAGPGRADGGSGARRGQRYALYLYRRNTAWRQRFALDEKLRLCMDG